MLPPLSTQSRTYDVIGLGESSVDLLLTMERFPEPDGKMRALEQARQPGGQIATAIRAVARLGWRAAFAGSVGDDADGLLLHDALRSDGVDVSASPRVRGATTRSAVILVDRARGTRSVIEHRDPALNLPVTTLPGAALSASRVLLVDGTDLVAAVGAARVARAAGVRVVVDVDEAVGDGGDLLRLADVVITSEGFVKRVGLGSVDAGLAALAEACPGAALVCATLGRRGARGRSAGSWVAVPAFEAPCVDSTGAGDVFRAGFIAAWLGAQGGPDAADALRHGCAAAALSCAATGAQGSLPTAREVQALLDSGRVVTTI